MATNEGRVYFALDGEDFDPDEVTRFLEIEPTYIKRKGERVPGRLPKMSSWVVSTDNVVNDYIDVFEMSNEIISRLKEKKNLIIEAIERFKVSPRFEVVLSIAMSEKISTPAIGFEVEVVKFLGDVGAFVDIDTYRN